MSKGVCVNLIDRSKAASAINLMLIIISWIFLKSICKIKILSQKHFFIWYLKNNMHNILLVNIYGREVQAFLVLSQPLCLKALALMMSINKLESKKRKKQHKTGSFLQRGEKAAKGNLTHVSDSLASAGRGWPSSGRTVTRHTGEKVKWLLNAVWTIMCLVWIHVFFWFRLRFSSWI